LNRSRIAVSAFSLSGDFAGLYSGVGPAVDPPEMLLRGDAVAGVLLDSLGAPADGAAAGVRSAVPLVRRDRPVWDHSSFSKNRDRLLGGTIAGKFLTAVLAQPRVKRLLPSEHFSVDGTRIAAWASMNSIKPKDPPQGGNDGRRAQRPGGFQGREAQQRDASQYDRSGCSALPQGAGGWKRSCASSAMR